MKIGELLEELITIAQVPKTDFSISMNMTPSGLSKILTGKRLPSFREKKSFSKQAARYFAEAIYCQGCYLKFINLFPVIYDFSSEYELKMFLAYAIEYALDQDFNVENNENTDFPDSEKCFLGPKTILNMFCVIVSNSIMDGQASLEFYSTLPLFNRLYADIFRRIRVSGMKKPCGTVFNHFFDMSAWEASFDNCNVDVLSTIVKAEQYVDLNLWKITKAIDYSFLLLRGQFLLLFSIQMDGTPLMTLITHKSYLTIFFNSLMKREAKKISYNKNEAVEFLEANPSFIPDLISRHIDTVYNFTYIGYLIRKEELEHVRGSKTVKQGMLDLFSSILSQDTVFFVTLDAMMSFYSSGKVIVPLVSAIEIPKDERILYLRRFDSYVNEKSHYKMRVLNNELPKMAALCSKGMSLIYVNIAETGAEKVHCFETDIIGDIFATEARSGTIKLLEFSSDLWDTYIDELSHRQ